MPLMLTIYFGEPARGGFFPASCNLKIIGLSHLQFSGLMLALLALGWVISSGVGSGKCTGVYHISRLSGEGTGRAGLDLCG